MNFIKKMAFLALSCLVASPVWAGQVDFCKVVRNYDDKDVSAPPQISYEDCSGVAFLSYGKYFVEAACWPGAVDLTAGKCALPKDNGADDKPAADADFELGAPE